MNLEKVLTNLQIIPLFLEFVDFASYVLASEVTFFDHLVSLIVNNSDTTFVTRQLGQQNFMFFQQISHTNQITTYRGTKQQAIWGLYEVFAW